jgi:cell division protein FtsB
MLEFQEKRKLRSFLYSKTTMVILVIFIVLAVNAVWGVYKKQRLTKENLAQTATTFDSLQAREKMLSSEIEKLKTEAGKEEEIREKYGLVKPGEEVIVVVNDSDNDNLDQDSTQNSFWKKIKDWFTP